jgi:hypothetical protein
VIDYFSALKYPISNVKSFIIGAIVTFLSIFMFPYFFLSGYLVRVIQDTNKGSEFLPEWEDWKGLFKDGFYVIAIQVAYLLPSLLLYAAATLATPITLSTALASNALPEIGTAAIVLILFSSFFMLAAFFLLPVALINFSLTKDFRKAFDLHAIARTVLTSPLHYVLNLAVGAFVFLLFIVIAPFLALVIAALFFYPLAFFYRLMAQWFTELP